MWGRSSRRILLSREEVLQLPEAAATLLAAPFDNVSGGWGAGPALVVAMVVAAAWRARERPMLVQATLAGLTAAVFHAVVSAVAQLPYGLDQVTTSRYRYVVLLLMLPGLALLLDAVASLVVERFDPARRRPAMALGLAVVCLLAVHASLGQYRVGRGVAEIGELTRTHLAGTILATEAGEKLLNDAVRGSYISGEDLARLRAGELVEGVGGDDPGAGHTAMSSGFRCCRRGGPTSAARCCRSTRPRGPGARRRRTARRCRSRRSRG